MSMSSDHGLAVSLFCADLCSWQWWPGELLTQLDNDIGSLVHCTYAHIPLAIQSKLAHEHFLSALLTQTSLAHPRSLLQVLKPAIKERCCWDVCVGRLRTIVDNPLDCCIWDWAEQSATGLSRGANKLVQAAMIQEEHNPRLFLRM